MGDHGVTIPQPWGSSRAASGREGAASYSSRRCSAGEGPASKLSKECCENIIFSSPRASRAGEVTKKHLVSSRRRISFAPPHLTGFRRHNSQGPSKQLRRHGVIICGADRGERRHNLIFAACRSAKRRHNSYSAACRGKRRRHAFWLREMNLIIMTPRKISSMTSESLGRGAVAARRRGRAVRGLPRPHHHLRRQGRLLLMLRGG
eukprot:gene9502-biopygen16730